MWQRCCPSALHLDAPRKNNWRNITTVWEWEIINLWVKMNSTNLYVTTTQIIVKADPNNPYSWQDLYRLIPYLRNSLCCVVCSHLLVNPYSPIIAQCQHHVCKRCKGGRKKIKPACEGCKDCRDYSENGSLRILLQCYKKMCIALIDSPIFQCLTSQASDPVMGFQGGSNNLISLIKEGASFEDDYKSNGGLPKATYSILPCIYGTSVKPQTTVHPQTPLNKEKVVQSRSSFYSVLYPGNGSKITLKRKSKEGNGSSDKVSTPSNRPKDCTEKPTFKKPANIKIKKGCRCGNATAHPGKLTCCGQRCPCYVESKPCVECRCRGCRNPHIKEGQKVMPHIPELQNLKLLTQPSPPSATATSTISRAPIMATDLENVGLEEIILGGQLTSVESLSANDHFKSFDFVGAYNAVPLSSDLLPGYMEEDPDVDIL